MHPQEWQGWTLAEQIAIAEFMETFEPEWEVPQGEFSDWHFWVLSKATKPQTYYFDRPIVFLMDRRDYSASDVILSSVKGIPNVTLLGAPSGGMSGAVVDSVLQHSEINLRLSSMASFQNTGRLFDGVGVEPDIHLEPEPEYYLVGGPDAVLERAIQIITTRDTP
jgi:C-terminal processing protease CtpA/Prc